LFPAAWITRASINVGTLALELEDGRLFTLTRAGQREQNVDPTPDSL